ncbi:hypothetical protein TL16_g06572 [Triparma laevis f. inornata]|uniref:Uncharacterized protein n=1 Tax=Triparma laevis f. inornata TaxID=1714386 RepID=A0A9W7ANE8_9STRA|nr:hypothetical protein TL16_g06572 [Triparma laevis f. inornata]
MSGLFSFLPASKSGNSDNADPNSFSSTSAAAAPSTAKPKLLKPAKPRFKPRTAVAKKSIATSITQKTAAVAVKRRRSESLEVVDIHASTSSTSRAANFTTPLTDNNQNPDSDSDSSSEMYDPSKPTDYKELLEADAILARQKEEAVLLEASSRLRSEVEDRKVEQRQMMVKEGKFEELREIETGRGRGRGRGRKVNNLPAWLSEGGTKK